MRPKYILFLAALVVCGTLLRGQKKQDETERLRQAEAYSEAENLWEEMANAKIDLTIQEEKVRAAPKEQKKKEWDKYSELYGAYGEKAKRYDTLWAKYALGDAKHLAKGQTPLTGPSKIWRPTEPADLPKE